MAYIIDTTKEEEINLAPGSVYEEVIQNLYFLYSSLEYDVPLDRGLGLNPVYVDRQIETAKALAASDIYDKTEQYEPRAEVVDIDFKEDDQAGILQPVVEVEINGEYDSAEYTG